jgi:hypothetical protein
MKKLTALLLSSTFILSACFEEKPKEPRPISFFKDTKNFETFKEVLAYCRNNGLLETDRECRNAGEVFRLMLAVSSVNKSFTAEQHQALWAAYTGVSIEERKRKKDTNKNAYGAPYQHIDP